MNASLTINRQQTIQYENPNIPVHDVNEPVFGNRNELLNIIGGLSEPSKMPGYSYSISAFRCNVGSALRNVEDSTCFNCYACKGNYIRFPAVQNAMERRYRSLFDSRWTAAFIAVLENLPRNNEFFRWHDSGDLQSMGHLRNIVNIASSLPQMKFWLPTREYNLVDEFIDTFGKFPDNLTVRVSAQRMNRFAPSRYSVTSMVISRDECFNDILSEYKSSGVNICPAPEQGGVCGTCRNCWDSSVSIVAYKEH